MIKILKEIFLFVNLIVFINITNAQSLKHIELADIWSSAEFYPSLPGKMVHMNDGEHYAALENNIFINKYEYKTGKSTETIVRSAQLIPSGSSKPISIDDFEFSTDETKILIPTKSERIYRHSKSSEYYVWDIKKQALTAVSDKGKQRFAQFSPDGNKVAFVMENNLYIKDLIHNQVTQITTDGLINNIINGASDWVYEEELDLTIGLYWSPDSRKIAYYRFDESKVKEFSMVKYWNLYPEVQSFKYPKAGEDNSDVSIHIYDIETGKTLIMETGPVKDQYIPRIKWSTVKDKLVIYRLNRLQNKLEFLLADAATGLSQVFYTETNKCFIDVNDNFFMTADGSHFIYTSVKNGHNHIYKSDMSGNEKQITFGDWEVIDIKAFDEKNNVIFYTSNEASVYNVDLYSIQTDGSGKTRITSMDGKNDVELSKSYRYFINNASNINTPPYVSICNIYGKELHVLEDNASVKSSIKEFGLTKAEYFDFETSDGVKLYGWMIRPADFDVSKKYPVLMYVYGGPGMQTVSNEWGYFDYIWFQMLAQKGYIVVSVDNRGTGLRGESFKKSTYKELGKLETADQIDVAKYLGHLTYVDPSRIGIFGWSYGGFLTLLCMTKGADYFKAGIAVAPVTNWRYYDNIYTERYMQKPQDNPEGYDNNSPVNYAKNLKGKLLICHGTADDNVHLQNTMEMSDALVKANKQFEMQLYTNKNHGIYGGNTRMHLYTRMTDFILKNL